MERPTPIRDRLLQLMQQHKRPAGITTAEIATRMNRSTTAINSMLGRLCAYGIVRKLTGNSSALPHELNRWSLPEC